MSHGTVLFTEIDATLHDDTWEPSLPENEDFCDGSYHFHFPEPISVLPRSSGKTIKLIFLNIFILCNKILGSYAIDILRISGSSSNNILTELRTVKQQTLANAIQNAKIMSGVKKIRKDVANFTKSSERNDREIRENLPNKSPAKFLAWDQRITNDQTFYNQMVSLIFFIICYVQTMLHFLLRYKNWSKNYLQKYRLV